MNTPSPAPATSDPPAPSSPALRPLVAPVATGLVCWLGITMGFLGLKVLMSERPEFVGRPMRTARTELLQESPRVVERKLSDDVSAVRMTQPSSSEVLFSMRGRRDYRGLRTISDMTGTFRADYVLTNANEEPIFLLFKCPQPRAGSGPDLRAGDLKLQASLPGIQENAKDAWLWSGTLAAHASVQIEISYQVGSLKTATYRVAGLDGSPVNHLRVTFQRQDLAGMLFDSGEGTVAEPSDTVVWERSDFLAPEFFSASIAEGRNLYVSLSQLLDIGPLLSLLFLLAAGAVILTRQRLTVIQMLTISAAYALYFPLILYLSANFTFAVAMAIAVVAPGLLLLNYARWLLGVRIGIAGGVVFLVLYQVFPTLAAFAGWNRGMVLLCLGVVTLWVLINLQNQALKKVMPATLLVLLLASGFSAPARAAEIQVVLPGELASRLTAHTNETRLPLLSYEPAHYQARLESHYLQVVATLPFRVVRPGELSVPLFGSAVHLLEYRIESAENDIARPVTQTNRLALFAQNQGAARLHVTYRVPFVSAEGKRRGTIPVLLGAPGTLQLTASRSDLEILAGSLWNKTNRDESTVYEIGLDGVEPLIVEWRGQGRRFPVSSDLSSGSNAIPGTMSAAASSSRDIYGIGLTKARNLTVINSDGSCTHFAEFELPVLQSDEFRLRLPDKARLLSVSVNGVEINAPAVEDRICRIKLPPRAPDQTVHRISFRLAYPTVKLGFIGTAELSLPEVFQTAGTLEWVVALPNGFETQVISSGLENQTVEPDLSQFGDYGRILRSHPHLYLSKDLAPPATISLSLKYRQKVPML